jgi:rhamnosyltransferase
MVSDLASNLTTLESGQVGVAAIGPTYYETNSQKQTKAYLANGPLLSRLSLKNEAHPVASDFIIASGSLIPLAILDEVGGFKEDLFIDLVDVEWCFRARRAGFKSFLSPTATVEHRLGSGTVKIGPRQVARHVPIRNYYWIRNAIWMACQSYTPPAWRIYFLTRSLAFLVVYTTLADKRARRLRLMIDGISHGLRGRMGRYD